MHIEYYSCNLRDESHCLTDAKRVAILEQSLRLAPTAIRKKLEPELEEQRTEAEQTSSFMIPCSCAEEQCFMLLSNAPDGELHQIHPCSRRTRILDAAAAADTTTIAQEQSSCMKVLCSPTSQNCAQLMTSMHMTRLNRYGRYMQDIGLVFEIPDSAPVQPKLVFSGHGKTYILDVKGRVFVLGSNSFHSLGIGATSRTLGDYICGVPLQVPTDSRAATGVCIQVAIGRGHTVFLMQDGTIQCVGANGFCQCGFEDSKLALAFPRAVALGEESPFITSISAGRLHTACLTQDGRIIAFGNLSFGSRRTDQSRIRERPTQLQLDGRRAIDVKCGEQSIVVLIEDGTIRLFNRDHVDGIALNPCAESMKIASIEAVSPSGLVFFAKSTKDTLSFVQASQCRTVITVKSAFEHKFEGRSNTMDLQMASNDRTVLLQLSQKRSVRSFVERLASRRQHLCDCAVHTTE